VAYVDENNDSGVGEATNPAVVNGTKSAKKPKKKKDKSDDVAITGVSTTIVSEIEPATSNTADWGGDYELP